MNEIPLITEPMGKYWTQPNPEEMAVDATHALVYDSAWGKLKNYELSLPSGCYPGKVWRCGNLLRWYGPENSNGRCAIEQRIIVLV